MVRCAEIFVPDLTPLAPLQQAASPWLQGGQAKWAACRYFFEALGDVAFAYSFSYMCAAGCASCTTCACVSDHQHTC